MHWMGVTSYTTQMKSNGENILIRDLTKQLVGETKKSVGIGINCI